METSGPASSNEPVSEAPHSASPSPSPALSACSYTSSSSTSSSDYDHDLNSLSLDDWGFPTQSSQGASFRAPVGRINTANKAVAQSNLSGASTPIAKRDASVPFTLAEEKEGEAGDVDEDTEEEDYWEEEEEEGVEPTGFDVEDEDEDDMHAHGVPAARGWRLKASKAKTAAFRAQVLFMFSSQLKLETWSEDTVDPCLLPLQPDNVELKRISGAFSNAVFFVSYKAHPEVEAVGPRTVLLRIYGSGTEVLLSRRAELLILHTLSSLYEIGPHILGTFANGRVETFFDAEPIGKEGMRDLGDRIETIREDGSLLVRGREGRAQWVARRMRQLHEVPLETMRAVLEQGDLRTGSENKSGLFGRGIENHLFARSHRPIAKRNGSVGYFDGKSSLPNQNMRDSPAPMTPAEGSGVKDTSIAASGVDGAHVQAMAIRGYSPKHRNSSVASFDSLATSYNSQDGGSVSSGSSDNLLVSPNIGPSSYSESVSAARRGQSHSPYTFNTPSASRRRGSSTSRHSSSASRLPYPGVWRRTKRWAREAGKVFALVDEFSKTDQGAKACEQALKGTPLEGTLFSPFPSQSPPRTHSLELGTTLKNLRKTLLAIASIDFPRLLKEMDAYKKYVRKWERANGASRRVLAHGDTQYSNLLLIKDGGGEDVGMGMPRSRDRSRETAAKGATEGEGRKGMSRQRSRTRLAPYERLIVIDFEYCSPNPRAYDIANAFQEWRFDYHSATESWSPYCLPFPTREERRRWLRAYVEQGRLLRMRGKTSKSSSCDSPATPPSEELALPPAVACAPLGGGQGEQASAKTKPSDPTASPSNIFGGRNKSFSAQTLDSPSLLATTSPSLNPTASPFLSGKSSLVVLEASMEREIDRLEREVEVYSIACHASWALWGVTFAKEQIESLIQDVVGRLDFGDHAILLEEQEQAAEAGSAESFDNLRYALGRVEMFRAESAALGIRV